MKNRDMLIVLAVAAFVGSTIGSVIGTLLFHLIAG